jgi:hypothetical protein
MESSRSWDHNIRTTGLGRSKLGSRAGLDWGLARVFLVWVYGVLHPGSRPFTAPGRRWEGYDRPLSSYRGPNLAHATSQREGVGR